MALRSGIRAALVASVVVAAATSCAGPVARATVVSPAACATADVIATDTAGLLPYAQCRELHSLTVRSGAAVDFTVLASLTTISGDLRIGPSVGITEIALPSLQSVGGTLRVAGNTLAAGLYTNKLRRVGHLEIVDNSTLATLALSALEAVIGDATIARNGDLSTLLALRWAVAGGVFRLQACRSLEFVELDPKFKAAEVQISDVPKLDWQSIPGAPAKPVQVRAGAGASSPGDPAF